MLTGRDSHQEGEANETKGIKRIYTTCYQGGVNEDFYHNCRFVGRDVLVHTALQQKEITNI